ncbi:MAG: ABC transporter permease subunit [Candidatus Heimdallarchaeota archaeon]|nr:ABC transporter permease subunit [Candidatus Heimdallarchaeota archaeon]
MSKFNELASSISSKVRNSLSIGYGSSISTIAEETFLSGIREKRFYLSLLYFTVFPILIFLVQNAGLIVQKGTGIALYQAQIQTASLINIFYASFFLGQVLIVILSADAIAGEIEQDTLSLLRSKPVYDSEIILGKFIGLLAIIFLLESPAFLLIYFFLLVRYEAGSIEVYLGTIDEIIAVLILVLLMQGIIVAMSLMFSTLFSKTLYSILSSMLVLFILSQISGILSNTSNYVSFQWLVNATLPEIFYNIEPIDANLPSLGAFILGFSGIISGLLVLAITILRNRELN